MWRKGGEMWRKGLVGFLFGVLALGSVGTVSAQNLLLNPGFESWTAGIPDHWIIGTTQCTTYQCSDTLHSGSFGCKLVFTSKSTQRLVQLIDVSPNLDYTCSLWVYDNHPHSRARIWLRWLDAAGNPVGTSSSDYSSDSTDWQVLTWSGLSPSNADSLSFQIRAYDVAWGDTVDTAHFYVDDASITPPSTPPTPPVISGVTHTPLVPDSADTVIISAQITDEGSVVADSMFYRINAGSFTPTPRDSISGSTYYYHIDPQSNNVTVSYYIWAKDNDDSVSVSDTVSYVVTPQVTQVTVSFPRTSGFPGDTVAVPISVSDLTGLEVYSLEFVVEYDTTILTAISIDTSNTLLNGAGWLTEWKADDSLSVASAGADSLGGSGNLIKLMFEVSSVASPGDSSSLIFRSFMFNEGIPDEVTVDSVFVITGLWGDVSENAEVTAYDASFILRYLLGLVTLTPSQQVVANVSGADGITALDASLILQYVVGIITEFPVQTGKEFPTAAVLTLEDVSGAPGEIVNVPVLIENSEGLLSAEFTLTFDPDVLSLEDVSATLSGFQCLYKEEEGEVKVVLAGTESPEEGNTVNFSFRVTGDAESHCEISLKDIRLNEEDVISYGASSFFNSPSLRFYLFKVYPNPGRQFTFRYCLPVDGHTILKIYDITGRTIRRLVDGPRDAGEHTAKWDGKDDAGKPVSSGIYFYQLKSGENNEIKKLTILRW